MTGWLGRKFGALMVWIGRTVQPVSAGPEPEPIWPWEFDALYVGPGVRARILRSTFDGFTREVHCVAEGPCDVHAMRFGLSHPRFFLVGPGSGATAAGFATLGYTMPTVRSRPGHYFSVILSPLTHDSCGFRDYRGFSVATRFVPMEGV